MVSATENSLEIVWKKPDSHNSKIANFCVYLSKNQKDLSDGLKSITAEDRLIEKVSADKCTYTLTNLTPASAYYVYVTAVNQHGEGYKAEPKLCMTQTAGFSKTRQMYVWGSNCNSELGLSDSLVAANKAIYK